MLRTADKMYWPGSAAQPPLEFKAEADVMTGEEAGWDCGADVGVLDVCGVELGEEEVPGGVEVVVACL